MAVLLLEELPLDGVNESLQTPQVSMPLSGPTLQSVHDGAVHHGQELRIVVDAESAQSVEAVDHVHRVAAGADHARVVIVLVLGEVSGRVAALLYLPVHVGEDVFESPIGDEVHVIWEEEDDVSIRRGELVIGDDVGNIYSRCVRELTGNRRSSDLA